MVAKIIFNIDLNGEVSLNVEGVSGSGCDKLTRPFEDILGIVEQRENKDSYYMSNLNENSAEVETDL